MVSPMKRRPELAVGWAVGSVVSAKLSCLALSVSGERESVRSCVCLFVRERETEEYNDDVHNSPRVVTHTRTEMRFTLHHTHTHTHTHTPASNCVLSSCSCLDSCRACSSSCSVFPSSPSSPLSLLLLLRDSYPSTRRRKASSIVSSSERRLSSLSLSWWRPK